MEVKKLSPAIHSVQSHHAVRKVRLGRSASFDTRDELSRLPKEQSDVFLERLNAIFRPGQDASYFASKQFFDQLMNLCARTARILQTEPRVLSLSSPVYCFGDTHGNLEDMKFFSDHVWPLGMPLTAGSFLFLGDYVDRGKHGLEVLAYLFAQKVQLPSKVFLIRGNHETRAVNGWEAYYASGSFLAQCKARFGVEQGERMWEMCNQVFDRLPLAATIDNDIFCVHGGIPRPAEDSVDDTRLERIRALPCPIDIQPPQPSVEDPENELAFSLLWADPADADQEDDVDSVTGFGESSRGGGTVIFGTKAVNDFLEHNRLSYIMRAHEATASGVAMSKSAKVFTVFSTSKDHGCGGDAKCGCVLVDRKKILAINRSSHYASTPRPPLGSGATGGGVGFAFPVGVSASTDGGGTSAFSRPAAPR